MRLTRLRPRATSDGERGVALVEFAIVVLFLFSLSMGMVEYGLAYQGQENTLGATRAGVRASAGLGSNRYADYEGLASLKADLASSGMLDKVELVVVYKSETANGQPPALCITGAAASTQKCNIYDQADISGLNKTTFGTNGCSTASVSNGWCPTARTDDQRTADYVGVYVRIRHGFITKFFGSGMAIAQRSVMRIEPTGG